jgi:type IV pilus assembly protein PilQ
VFEPRATANSRPADKPYVLGTKTAAAAPRATRILGVTPAEEDGQLAVTIRADGALKYQDFFLGNPDRLVVDFKDVVSRAPYKAEVQRDPVRMVRLAQFSASAPKVARLVLDLSARQPYRIVEGGDGVKIVFGEGRTPRQAPLAALKAEAATELAAGPAAQPVPPRSITPIPMPAVIEPQGPATPLAPTSTTAAGTEIKRWTGHPISLDFKEGDLQDIFRLFADISGLNVVVNPGISGRVTLKLTEVPWDQALDLILKINGLGYAIEDNVLRIAKLTDMQREEADKRKLEEEKQLAGTLEDWTKRIFYAKAADISDVIKKAGALSPRGQINVDTRTNTLLMRDLPRFIDKAKILIADLDVATPQVEIEARIVVTSRNFTRDLGVQWGFLNQQTYQFGNNTQRAFPHSIILNGQGVPSTGGIPADQGGLASDAGIGTAGRGYAVNLPAAGFNTALGITMGNILGNFNLDVALTALERQGRGRLLSTPKVTTQNNQAAEIKQGVQIPIQTVANNTVTVTFKDAVLTLRVTPQISEAGTVILGLEVENNSADFANLVNGVPHINTQSAKTNVLVRDGSTAVIGGIYQSQEQQANQQTPFLSKLPVLGYLFRNKFVTSQNNELLLFVTPRIIKS